MAYMNCVELSKKQYNNISALSDLILYREICTEFLKCVTSVQFLLPQQSPTRGNSLYNASTNIPREVEHFPFSDHSMLKIRTTLECDLSVRRLAAQ